MCRYEFFNLTCKKIVNSQRSKKAYQYSNEWIFLPGQFLHRHVTVHQRGTNRKNQIVGDIFIEEAGMPTKHVRSFLKEKPDEVTGNLELCWNAHNGITKTAESVQHFFVDDIMEMQRRVLKCRFLCEPNCSLCFCF